MKRTIVNPIYKDTVTFINTAAETGGAYTLLELTLLPGGRNPPHIHKAFTEKFTVIDGQLGLELKNGSRVLRPGESYTVKVNEVHNFFNPSDQEIRFQVLFTPGHSGIENALCIAYGLAADGLSDKKGRPKDFSIAALMMKMSDSYPKGLLSLLTPLLSMVAKRARKKGMEQRLVEKYCQPLKRG
jgi:quercetin dioxygenase-like cupin family protein